MQVMCYEDMVASDSWTRIVDLFVNALPIEQFGFTHSKLNIEGNIPYHPKMLPVLIDLLLSQQHPLHDAVQVIAIQYPDLFFLTQSNFHLS